MVRQDMMRPLVNALGVVILAALMIGLMLSGGCTTPSTAVPRLPAPQPLPATSTDNPPPLPREFRAAWIATVANIDWPSAKTLSLREQQAEIIAIVEKAKALRLNAIILQVRPSADAIYPSALEPWSEFLTGAQGRAPEPLYDPLHMWIDEAHKRGIELHAWFNPFRARHPKATSPSAPSHVSNTSPGIVKTYGDLQWMDPGERRAADHTFKVIMDVVRRYDIDGVHMDDYFYPYPIQAPAGRTPRAAPASKPVDVEFPDDPSWSAYVAGGGKLTRSDWRRQNINQLIERIHDGIRREKHWLRFGISPFGIGRPDRRPVGISGFSQYDKLYADVELWQAKCWVDYLAPQLYWPISQSQQAYGVLFDYWLQQNTCGRHVWPGLFTSKIDGSATSWQPDEIVNQIKLARTRASERGHIHFSMAALVQNRMSVGDQLAAVDGVYAEAALIPALPWLNSAPARAPQVTANWSASAPDHLSLAIDAGRAAAGGGAAIQRYAIWHRYGNDWRLMIVTPPQDSLALPVRTGAVKLNRIVVSAINRYGSESERIGVPIEWNDDR